MIVAYCRPYVCISRRENWSRGLDGLCEHQVVDLREHQQLCWICCVVQRSNELVGFPICLQASQISQQQEYIPHFRADVPGSLAWIPLRLLHDVLYGVSAHFFRKGGKLIMLWHETASLTVCLQYLDHAGFPEQSKVSAIRSNPPRPHHYLRHLQGLCLHHCRILSHTVRLSEILQVVGHLQGVLFHRSHRHYAYDPFMAATGD